MDHPEKRDEAGGVDGGIILGITPPPTGRFGETSLPKSPGGMAANVAPMDHPEKRDEAGGVDGGIILGITPPPTGRFGETSLPPDFTSHPLRPPAGIRRMLPESRPERESRTEVHVPPDWVSPDATFFITINCNVRGVPQLTAPGMPEKLFGAVAHYHHSRRWWPEILLLMPDHLHALISFSWDEKQGMNSVIRAWKRYTARAFGIGWQREYFDHRIRSEADHQSTWVYIRENPARAGLVEQAGEWPHVWLPDRIGWGGRDVSPKRPAGDS